MSRIYFHSEHGDAELRGSERAYMGMLCDDLMMAAIGDLDYAKRWLLPLLPPSSWGERDLSLYLRSTMGSKLIVDGEAIDTFTISLNTAIAIGGAPMRLLARLHGQCEIHCWVDGPNRKWLAGVMREGRESGLYRAAQGWEAVADLLDSRDDCPIVCSYSVCEQFPNFSSLPDDHALKLSHDDRRTDWFYDLPANEAWAACMGALRKAYSLEIRPDHNIWFGGGHSVFTLPREVDRPAIPPKRGQV